MMFPCSIGSSHSVKRAWTSNGAHWSCARGRRKSRRTTMSQALRWWDAACPSIGIPPNHFFFGGDFYWDFPWNKPSKLGSLLIDGKLHLLHFRSLWFFSGFKSLDPLIRPPYRRPHDGEISGPRGGPEKSFGLNPTCWLMIPICLGC